jgi:2-polyprenyl-3-methyl-5-hydroxy-6-metoxy-1,4-benzoquinol methylase
MWESSLELIRCPRCRGSVELVSPRGNGEIVGGELRCPACRESHPIHDGIPRFVPPENYAASFGFEWERFAELQTDRLHGHSLTRDRFFLELGCRSDELAGLRVLEAGCGGGRFSDVALAAGAEVFAVDLSNAVDKNRELGLGNRRLHLFQASIEALPLAHGAFDLVFCYGVLQHTPSPAAFFRSLVPFVKPGGKLAVDIYAAHPKQSLHWKYLVRPMTKRMPRARLLAWIEAAAPVLVPVSRGIRRVPRLGKALSRLVPICVHDGFMGKVSPQEEVRWAVLETFDALTPAYDRPRSLRTLRRWFEREGLVDVEAFCLNHGLNYARGRKPA